jgi:hypothetical protein
MASTGRELLAATFPGVPMKLPLISASVIAYTLIAMAWICYAELILP